MKSFRTTAILVVVYAALCPPANAQSHTHGYIFVAPGAVSDSGKTDASLQAGLGGEGVFLDRVGLGAELSALGVRGNSDTLFGLASVNGYLHIRQPNPQLDPFLTAGYSVLFQFINRANLFNIGGGMNWWFAPHLGLKAEFRDHVHTSDETINVLGFRFGLAFH